MFLKYLTEYKSVKVDFEIKKWEMWKKQTSKQCSFKRKLKKDIKIDMMCLMWPCLLLLGICTY